MTSMYIRTCGLMRGGGGGKHPYGDDLDSRNFNIKTKKNYKCEMLHSVRGELSRIMLDTK